MHLILIGFRGSGKTTIAEHLAARLELPMVDADDQVEQLAGKSIAELFRDEGEPHFRDLESQVLAEICGREPHVVATGGGAILREENRQALIAAGQVVWLRVLPATAHQRIHGDPLSADRRPNLKGSGDLTEIQELLALRDPIYGQSAHLAVDTELRDPAELAEEIILRLGLG